MSVGRWTYVRGRPIIEITNAAGDALCTFSEEVITLLGGDGRPGISHDVFLNSGVRIECWREVTFEDQVLLG